MRKHLFTFLAILAALIVLGGSAAAKNSNPPQPGGQAGTTLMTGKTAEGFSECRGGVEVFGVRGAITVTNGGDRPTEGLSIVDVIQIKTGSEQYRDYVSTVIDLGTHSVLAPGETWSYAYTIYFTPVEGALYRNVANITILNHSGWLPGGRNCTGPEPCAFGPSPKASFTLPAPNPDRCVIQGCTLTIGYWKTHAGFTGGNKDMVTRHLPIWLGTANGAKSVQVTSAAQAVTILEFSGNAANGINKLYAQMLGAKLNIANGASSSAVADVLAAADAYLATHDATDWANLGPAERGQVLTWMTHLDNYNNGLIGPGHCE